MSARVAALPLGPMALALLLLMAVVPRLSTLGQPLLEKHGFRQTQTAYTALLYHEEGIDLLHPKLPILGNTYDVPLEFPLFQALGAVVMGAGIQPDRAMRITALAFFLMTAIFVWLVVGDLAGRLPAALATAAFVLNPYGLVWSRASLIEYLATAAAVGAVWATLRWRDRGDLAWLAPAIVLGSIAMLVKPTTAIFWTLPVILHIAPRDPRGLRGWVQARLRPLFVLALAVPFALGLAWTVYADSVKRADPGTAFLTSSSLWSVTFGLPEQRLDPEIWWTILGRVFVLLVGLALLPVLAVGVRAALQGSKALTWTGIALAFLAPIVTFFDLYYHHDYYLIAVSPAVAMFLGLGLARVLRLRREPAYVAAAGAILLIAFGTTVAYAQPYWADIYLPLHDPDGVLPRARELASVTRPSDRVVVIGRSYNSDLLYYARRRGQMSSSPFEFDAGFLGSLPGKGYQVVSSWDPARDPVSVARYWAWTGAVSGHDYLVGAAPPDLRDAGLMATDDVAAFERAREGGARLGGSRTVSCADASGTELPAGPSGTWIRLAPNALPDTIVHIGSGLAPLPVRSIIFIAPAYVTSDMGGGPISFRCSHGAALTIESVIGAGPP